MRGDPQYEGTSFESRFIQNEREYIFREVPMPCHTNVFVIAAEET